LRQTLTIRKERSSIKKFMMLHSHIEVTNIPVEYVVQTSPRLEYKVKWPGF